MPVSTAGNPACQSPLRLDLGRRNRSVVQIDPHELTARRFPSRQHRPRHHMRWTPAKRCHRIGLWRVRSLQHAHALLRSPKARRVASGSAGVSDPQMSFRNRRHRSCDCGRFRRNLFDNHRFRNLRRGRAQARQSFRQPLAITLRRKRGFRPHIIASSTSGESLPRIGSASASIASATTGVTCGAGVSAVYRFDNGTGETCGAGVSTSAIASTTTSANHLRHLAFSTTMGATITCSRGCLLSAITSKRQDLRVFAFRATSRKLANFPAPVRFNFRDDRLRSTRIAITVLPASALPAIIAAPSVSTRTTSKLGRLGNRTCHKLAAFGAIRFRRSGATTATVSTTASLRSAIRLGHARKRPAHISCDSQRPHQNSRASARR